MFHEEKHIDQIARADLLVPVAPGTSFRYGWAWNQAVHNHWGAGTDGAWGVASHDDDGNGTDDDAAPLPGFEPGNGDDVSLSRLASPWQNWPAAWPVPAPTFASTGHEVEDEAIMWSNSQVTEDDHADEDWGAPGKQYDTPAWND